VAFARLWHHVEKGAGQNSIFMCQVSKVLYPKHPVQCAGEATLIPFFGFFVVVVVFLSIKDSRKICCRRWTQEEDQTA
jgi:hypothetical protein